MHHTTRLLALILCTASTLLPVHSRTFYKQSVSPSWLDPFALHTVHRHPDTQSEAAFRTTMHVEPFYWHSSNKKKLGDYFGFYDDVTEQQYNFIRVDADAQVATLRPQDIIHNSANAASETDPIINPLSETITLNPSIEQYGFLMANTMHIGDQFKVHTLMPWVHQTNSLGMVHTDAASQIVEGYGKSVTDFFTGAVAQKMTNSPDQQDPLHYGKLLESQTVSGLADITVLFAVQPVCDEHLKLNVGLLATLATSSRPLGQYLFEPTLGTGGHTVIGGHLNARIHLATIRETVTLDGLISFVYRVGLSAQETRSPGFQLPLDGGLDAQYLRYALGGKQNTRRLFPLINVLTQPVNVMPGSAADAALALCANYRWLQARLMYKYHHTDAERITPLSGWPNRTFDMSRLDYAQTSGADPITHHTFDIATHGSPLTAALNEDNVLFEAAATPAQSTHTIGLSVAAAPIESKPHMSFALRTHVAFTAGQSFGLGGYGVSASFSQTF